MTMNKLQKFYKNSNKFVLFFTLIIIVFWSCYFGRDYVEAPYDIILDKFIDVAAYSIPILSLVVLIGTLTDKKRLKSVMKGFKKFIGHR